MAKKDFKGGLSALLGEVPTNETKTPQEAQKRSTEANKASAGELLNTIEDEKLREALHRKRMDGRGRPRKGEESGKLTEGYSRTSLILKDENVAKIKEIAFRHTLTMKEIVNYALEAVIQDYESDNGEIKPNPDRYKGNIDRVLFLKGKR